MTAPNGVTPDGAYVISSNYGSDVPNDQQSVIDMITGKPKTDAHGAANGWKGQFADLANLAGQVRDGQLDLNNRLDLLEEVSGYCSTFMGNNWNVAGGRWVTLPFEQQLGPNKNAEKFQGGIKFNRKGLWRADCHVTFAPAPSNWIGGTNTPATVSVDIVRISDQQVYTSHHFDIVLTTLGPETAAFSHTFVLPEDNAFYAKVLVIHPKDWAGVYGGTLRSSLSVNRWDSGTANAVVAPDVPHGGNLG